MSHLYIMPLVKRRHESTTPREPRMMPAQGRSRGGSGGDFEAARTENRPQLMVEMAVDGSLVDEGLYTHHKWPVLAWPSLRGIIEIVPQPRHHVPPPYTP